MREQRWRRKVSISLPVFSGANFALSTKKDSCSGGDGTCLKSRRAPAGRRPGGGALSGSPPYTGPATRLALSGAFPHECHGCLGPA